MIYDRDIREPLFEFLEQEYGKIRILEEKKTGKSRADVVMVTQKALVGIEIKSDADTYARLAGQVKDYDRCYDYNMVVVGGTHGIHIREHVPDHWGVITVEFVDGAFDFYFLRRPLPNPKLDWEKKLMLLWRPELAKLQEWHAMPKYKEKSRQFVAAKIAERIPERIAPEELGAQVSDLLYERDYTHVEETLREYRKGELTRRIEQETDPVRRLELMTEKAERAAAADRLHTGRRRRRRRH